MTDFLGIIIIIIIIRFIISTINPTKGKVLLRKTVNLSYKTYLSNLTETDLVWMRVTF